MHVGGTAFPQQHRADDEEILKFLTAGPGRVILHGRDDKWPHTRDFWTPLGCIDEILKPHLKFHLFIQRHSFLHWLTYETQLRHEKVAQTDPTTYNRGPKAPTGYYAFQILKIPVPDPSVVGGVKTGYFFRPQFDAITWRRFTLEDPAEKARRRAVNRANRGGW